MENRPRTLHFIYKTTCLITNRFYIGMHSSSNIDDGYLGSGKILFRSLEKYGKENHSREILEYLDSRDALKIREREIINEELLSDPLCMNLQKGGMGGFISEEHQLRASRAGGQSGGQARFAAENPEFMKNHGSKIFKRLHESGKLNSSRFKGKKHSPESKEKQSLKKIGANNPMAGTVWMNNGIQSKIVKKHLVDELLKNGYSKGRLTKKV